MPIGDLQGLKIGISGQFFLEFLFERLAVNPIIGLSKQRILNELKCIDRFFTQKQVKYTVVFDGQTHWKQNEKQAAKSIAITIKDVWTFLQKAKYQDTEKEFKQLFNYFCKAFDFFKGLQELQISFMVAPYSCQSQLKYMLQNQFINVVLSDISFLAYLPMSSLICLVTGINLEKEEAYFFNIKEFIGAVKLTQTQMKEVLVFDGLISKSFTLASKTRNFSSNLEYFTDFYQTNPNSSLSDLLVEESAQIFKKDLQLVQYMPFLDEYCNLKPQSLEIQNIQIMNELFGNQLPQFLYFFQSCGLISSSLLTLFVSNQTYTTSVMADSLELRLLYNVQLCEGFNLTIFLQKLLLYVLPHFSASFKELPFKLINYFDTEEGIPLTLEKSMEYFIDYFDFSEQNFTKDNPGFIKVMKFFCSNSKSQSASRKGSETIQNQGSPIPKATDQFFGNAGSQKLNQGISPLEIKDRLIQKSDQELMNDFKPVETKYINATAKLNFLTSLDFITPKQLKASILAKALRKCQHKSVEEEVLIILHILQSNVNTVMYSPFSDTQTIKNMNYSEKYTKNLKNYKIGTIPSGPNQKSIILISRIFGFIPLDYVKWEKNMYSFDCTQFMQFIKNIQQVLQWGYEMIMISSFMQMKDMKLMQQFQQASYHMPFRKIYNCGLSIIIQNVLMGNMTISEVFKLYPGCQEGLKRGYLLWKSVNQVLESPYFKNDQYTYQIQKEFKDASIFLEAKIDIKSLQ